MAVLLSVENGLRSLFLSISPSDLCHHHRSACIHPKRVQHVRLLGGAQTNGPATGAGIIEQHIQAVSADGLADIVNGAAVRNRVSNICVVVVCRVTKTRNTGESKHTANPFSNAGSLKIPSSIR